MTRGPSALWLTGLAMPGAHLRGTSEVEPARSAHTAMWKSDTEEQNK